MPSCACSFDVQAVTSGLVCYLLFGWRGLMPVVSAGLGRRGSVNGPIAATPRLSSAGSRMATADA